ncbi:ABC transporter permease [Mucisphaera calidilacus]|uniref:ABC-2 family transporter protein n=1 Tax=Mucisphaera calidilacus TaxID=2527982 RepID=A0A518BV83_9BACT|nr:ABC transporter permease [Mucisphaera calidilacus]QDU70857.1 ABC-2 family transporter protein [Mucisphaera calidilacus]
MYATWTIAKRETLSLFYAPVAYLVLGLFTFIASMIFLGLFDSGAPASMRNLFFWVAILLAFVLPAVSMRLLSEEIKSGTLELIMTAPVSDAQLVLGKWIGALIFYLAMLSPLVLQVLILELHGTPDYGPILTGLAGLVLVGAFYLAIGVFASSLSDSQIVAYMVTALFTGMFTVGLWMIGRSVSWLPEWSKKACYYLSVVGQYEDFSKGLIDTSNFVYFVSLTLFFLFLAVKLVESRRWR